MRIRDGAPCDECRGTAFTACVRFRCYRESRIASAGLVAARWIDWSRGRRSGYGADRYVANSESTRRRHVEHGLRPDGISVLHLPAEDLAAQAAGGRDVEAPQAKPRLTFVGSLLTAKGPWIALELAAALPEFEVQLIGSGPDERELRPAAAKNRLDNVVFRGLVTGREKTAAWAGSFLTLVPSLWDEPFGLVVPESYSLGVPVLATAAGGLAEIVADGETGLRLDAADIAGAAAQVRALRRDEPRSAHMRTAARAAYEVRFREDVFAPRLEALLLEAAARRGVDEDRPRRDPGRARGLQRLRDGRAEHRAPPGGAGPRGDRLLSAPHGGGPLRLSSRGCVSSTCRLSPASTSTPSCTRSSRPYIWRCSSGRTWPSTSSPATARSPLLSRLLGMPAILNVDGLDSRRAKWAARTTLPPLGGAERAPLRHPRPSPTPVSCRRSTARSTAPRPTSSLTAPTSRRARTRASTCAASACEPREYVLFVGRLVPENNAHVLVEAFEGLDTGPQARHRRRRALRGRVPGGAHATTDPRVIFTGYVFGDGYRELARNAAIFVAPTEVGGTHPVLVEAMAAGNCVVVNDYEPNLEAIGDAGVSYSGKDGAVALREVLGSCCPTRTGWKRCGRPPRRGREHTSRGRPSPTHTSASPSASHTGGSCAGQRCSRRHPRPGLRADRPCVWRPHPGDSAAAPCGTRAARLSRREGPRAGSFPSHSRARSCPAAGARLARVSPRRRPDRRPAPARKQYEERVHGKRVETAGPPRRRLGGWMSPRLSSSERGGRLTLGNYRQRPRDDPEDDHRGRHQTEAQERA